MYFVMDLPLTVTSVDHPWFQSSLKGTGEYANWYIWKTNVTGMNQAYWKSSNNGKFYQVQKDHKYAVLNWANDGVRKHMLSIVANWTSRGVDGFYLPYVDYFARTNDGSRPDWDKVYPLLASVRNKTDSADRTTPILLYTAVADMQHDAKQTLIEEGGLNYILNTDLLFADESSKCNHEQAAECIYNKLGDSQRHRLMHNESYPMWEIGGPNVARIATRAGSNASAELWTMLLLALPGSLNTYYGDEIGMINSDTVVNHNTSSLKGACSPMNTVAERRERAAHAHAVERGQERRLLEQFHIESCRQRRLPARQLRC
jgi:glycosidase